MASFIKMLYQCLNSLLPKLLISLTITMSLLLQINTTYSQETAVLRLSGF